VAALLAAVRIAAAAAEADGPYGLYPKGPLSAEDAAGPNHRLASPMREELGARIAAALEHAHMLVYHPRDASPAHLQALIDAGWSTTGIVVISQLVAFLSYQIRVVTGLRVLKARSA
jgi:CMD domain protein